MRELDELNEVESRINDSFVDVFGTRPTDSQIADIEKDIPSDLASMASIWGWNDTEIREEFTAWLEKKVAPKKL